MLLFWFLFFSVEEGFPTIKGDPRTFNFITQYKDAYKKHLHQRVQPVGKVLHKIYGENKIIKFGDNLMGEQLTLFQKLSIAAQSYPEIQQYNCVINCQRSFSVS